MRPLFVCVFFLSSCSRGFKRADETLPSAGEFSAPGACDGCHSEIAKTYRDSGMHRSFGRLTADLAVEDYAKNNQFFHRLSDAHFAMVRRDNHFYQRRWQIGPDGKELNAEELQVDYFMGSGNHARTFLHRTGRGTLIELPLAWYAEKGGYWAMNPGYDTAHPETRRLIGYDCMACHNAYPELPPGHASAGSEPVFTANIPSGIDCQRCHGPGANHVRSMQAKPSPAEARASIVNPSRLSTERQLDVCMQCHLETTSFTLPNVIKRFNRDPFSYRPGEPLGDFAVFFDHKPGSGREGKFEIVSSAYRLRQSRCFLESRGKLTCQRCHNPHNIPRGGEAVLQYSRVCRQCHTEAFTKLVSTGSHTADSNCIDCHMPKRRTEDVVHAVMTDHLIQRRRSLGNLLGSLTERHETGQTAYRGPVALYYPIPLPNDNENGLYVATAQVLQNANLSQGLATLAEEIAKKGIVAPEFHLALGDAQITAGQASAGIASYGHAVQLIPHSTFALRKLGVALRDNGQSAKAAEILLRATQADPGDPHVWYDKALLDSALGHSAVAIAALERACTLDPDFVEAFSTLGAELAEGGDKARAEAYLRAALRIDPWFAPAQANLGQLLASQGRHAEASYYLGKAVLLDPLIGGYHFNYAVTLSQLNRNAEAIQQLQLAAKGSDATVRQRAEEVLRQLR